MLNTAVKLPQVAVIAAVPSLTASTTPSIFTFTTASSLEAKVIGVLASTGSFER